MEKLRWYVTDFWQPWSHGTTSTSWRGISWSRPPFLLWCTRGEKESIWQPIIHITTSTQNAAFRSVLYSFPFHFFHLEMMRYYWSWNFHLPWNLKIGISVSTYLFYYLRSDVIWFNDTHHQTISHQDRKIK